MFQIDWRKHAHLKTQLIQERSMLSLMEKEIAIMNGDLVQNHENWVKMWVDQGHFVTSDEGLIKAYRGIDFDGKFMWLVRHPAKKHGYHSTLQDPFDAIEEAKAAWSERARVKAKWPEVQNLAWGLVFGRISLTVTREDAYNSALCSAGIDAFMKRIGMPQRQAIGGRSAAILMLVDAQLGFVINSAFERVTKSESSATLTAAGGYLLEGKTG